jgi:hypothetical protein
LLIKTVERATPTLRISIRDIHGFAERDYSATADGTIALLIDPRGVGLDLMAARLAPHDQPHAGRGVASFGA